MSGSWSQSRVRGKEEMEAERSVWADSPEGLGNSETKLVGTVGI